GGEGLEKVRWLRCLLAIAHAHDAFKRNDKDLPITDGAGGTAAGPLHNCIDGWLDKIIVHRDIESHFTDQVHLHRLAAEIFRVAPLPAVALDIRHGQAKYFHL